MTDDVADVDELVDALRSRPGRGGVRLSYKQAGIALRLLRALPELLVERRHLHGTIRRQREQLERVEERLARTAERLGELEARL